MVRVYIDFDSTLYNTSKVKEMINEIVANGVCKNVPNADKFRVLEEIEKVRENGFKSVLGLCELFEKKYGLESNVIKSDFVRFLSDGERFLYDDTIPFLKNLAQKNYEINMLTYTSQDSYEYQMIKILGSKIFHYFNNIIICTKKKGEIELDYENGFFIDDNPEELKSLYNVGVSENRLFRMKRGGGYSEIEISEFSPIECKSFVDIDL